MALIRRLPKIGFSNYPHKKIIEEISLDELSRSYGEGEEVTIQSFRDKKLLPKTKSYIKILSTGKIDKKLNLAAGILVTKGAEKEIVSAGGSVSK